MPPCTFGCSVTTRWPRIAGQPGELGDVGDRQSGVGDGGGRAAARQQLPPGVGEAAGEVDDAGLVVHGEQGGGHDGDGNESVPPSPQGPDDAVLGAGRGRTDYGDAGARRELGARWTDASGRRTG